MYDILHMQIIKKWLQPDRLRIWKAKNYGSMDDPYQPVPFSEIEVYGSADAIHSLWCSLSSLEDYQRRENKTPKLTP